MKGLSAVLALKISIPFAILFSLGFILKPDSALDRYGFLAKPDDTGSWRGKKVSPPAEEVAVLQALIQLTGLAMLGWVSLFMPIVRKGDEATAKIVCALLTLMRIPLVYTVLNSGNDALVKQAPLNVLLLIVSAAGAFSTGKPKIAMPKLDKIGASGKAMLGTAAIGVVSILPAVLNPASHMIKFSAEGHTFHPDITSASTLVVSIWSLILLSGALGRVAVIIGGNKKTIYSVCRAVTGYFAMFSGFMVAYKTLASHTNSTMLTIQTIVIIGCNLATYFACLIDDGEFKSAAKSK